MNWVKTNWSINVAENKERRLWLNIKQSGVDVSREKFIQTLIDSIEEGEGEYRLPKGWNVWIEWRNKEAAPMRSDEWSEAMQESAESSDGWDKAVLAWLRSKQKKRRQ